MNLKTPYTKATFATFVIVIILFLLQPIVYLLVWAFWGSETVGILANKPSLGWFEKILFDSGWQKSIFYSGILAISSSLISCGILTIHFYFARFTNLFFEKIAYFSVLLIILIPSITYALSLRIIGTTFGINEYQLMLIGHIVIVLPVQFFVFESKQDSIHSDLLFAGSVLGASHWKNIFFVYLPLIKDSLWSSFVVGFFYSFDELVIATFILNSSSTTVPKRLWDQVHRSMDPSPAIVSTMLLLVYVFPIIIIYGWSKIKRRNVLKQF